MTPGQVQPVTVHGHQLALTKTAGGDYVMTDPTTGRVLAQHWSRFLAVAQAAKALALPVTYGAALCIVCLDVFVWRAA